MNELILNGITVDQFLVKIGELFDEKISLTKQPIPTFQTEYLSRKEVSKLLKVSIVTLHDWTKHGFIPSYKIGNRVLYKPKEVEEAVKQVSIIKHKRGII